MLQAYWTKVCHPTFPEYLSTGEVNKKFYLLASSLAFNLATHSLKVFLTMT